MKSMSELQIEFNEWVWNECMGDFDMACKQLGIQSETEEIKKWKDLYRCWVEKRHQNQTGCQNGIHKYNLKGTVMTPEEKEKKDEETRKNIEENIKKLNEELRKRLDQEKQKTN